VVFERFALDYFLYSGPIERGSDLDFVSMVAAHKKSDAVTLILSTGGGSPDAAYKMGRYLQKRYDAVTVFVPGFCKSAGTLLAIAANDLIFSPYGELGPLDIQMSKQDNLMGMESGLNISEAFASMEGRARETFHQAVSEIVAGSGGVVSFAIAAKAASDIVGSMYGPVFSQIDPEEVGSRSRAMRIGESYGSRLNQKFRNMRNGGMEVIAQSYPSHGFVIDMDEVSHLFERVREATETEKALVDSIGRCCRFPESKLMLSCVTDEMAAIEAKVVKDENPKPQSDEPEDGKGKHGKDSPGTGKGKRAASRKGADEARPTK